MLFDTKTYLDTKDGGNKLFEELSNKYMFWAFSADQFREGIKKLEENLGGKAGEDWKVRNVGGGGYCYAPKANEVIEASYGGKRAVISRLGHNDFTRGAFLYEMLNNEYTINWEGDYDVCSYFSIKPLKYGEERGYRDYLEEAGYGYDVIRAYEEARRECVKRMEEW